MSDIIIKLWGDYMEVTQIYELINAVTTEITGNSGLIHEDLSNVVDTIL